MIEKKQYRKEIERRVASAQEGNVFIPSDFFDIAEATTINKILERLVEKKLIRKIGRGLYDKPIFSPLLQEYQVPKMEEIAQALARNHNWHIVPAGDTALNLLGLSTQVAAHWTYLSDGPYRIYTFGNTSLQFKHTANKNISKMSQRSALIIQALRALGKEVVADAGMLDHISKTLGSEDKQRLLAEARYTTAWIYKIVKILCAEKIN
jgi:hypothetical protein